MSKVKAGFVSFGIADYPRELIERKGRQGLEWLQSSNIEVTSTALVNDNPDGEDVRRAIAELSNVDIDLLVACVAGWIPSQVVINVLSEFRHLPILLWGLAGNWEGGRLVTTAEQAGTTAFARAFQAGERSLVRIFDKVRVEAITPEEMERAGLGEGELTNMNTPEDWARITGLSKGGRFFPRSSRSVPTAKEAPRLAGPGIMPRSSVRPSAARAAECFL